MRSSDCIIIGAGANSLVAAAVLARAGRKVLVLERLDRVGGTHASAELHPGYRFDTAMTSLGCLPPLLSRQLRLSRHGLNVHWAGMPLLALERDGHSLPLWRDERRTVRSLRMLSVRDAERWPAFCARAARLAGFLRSAYMLPAPQVPNPGLGDAWTLVQLGLKARGLGRMEMLELLRVLPLSVSEWLDEWFESDLLKGALGAGGVQNINLGPQAAGTALGLLHHHVGAALGDIRPVGFVRGGMARLGEALAVAAQAAGATIELNSAVASVLVRSGQAAGVVLVNGSEIKAATVVSGLDPKQTLLELVGGDWLEPGFVRRVNNIRGEGIAARVHLALDGLPGFPDVPSGGMDALGRISISPSLEYVERAHDCAKYGRVSNAPVLEAVIPSLSDASLAPAGCHVMSVAVQYTPWHLRAGAWNAERSTALRDNVVALLDAHIPGLRARIQAAVVHTPADFEREFGAPRGNLYHADLTLDQILFMRPIAGWAQYRTPVRGLYMCGPANHPGAGITGVAGYHAARAVLHTKP